MIRSLKPFRLRFHANQRSFFNFSKGINSQDPNFNLGSHTLFCVMCNMCLFTCYNPLSLFFKHGSEVDGYEIGGEG